MKTFSEKELKEILDKHTLWLKNSSEGTRANLTGANLIEANLSGANLTGAYLIEADLSGANLTGAYLIEADLSRADLTGAYLIEADLSRADLSGANLSEADLSGAYLSGANLTGAYLIEADLIEADLSRAYLSRANLSGAYLTRADLSRADLSGADLSGADLSGADLSGADLSRANLSGANLSGANLSGANLSKANIFFPIACPEKGSFIGFKKCKNSLIVELKITEDAERCSATRRKCRCSKAEVISITNIDGSASNTDKAISMHDENFIYEIGKTVEVTNFDENRWNECSTGIHFFITRQEAVNYRY